MIMRRLSLGLAGLLLFLMSVGYTNKPPSGSDENCEGCKSSSVILPSEEEIARKLSSASRLIAYQAFRKSDTTICKKAINVDDCYDSVQLFSLLSAMGKGQASEMPARYRQDFQPISNALRDNSCSSLPTATARDLCQGIISQNAGQIAEVLRNPLFPEIPKSPDDMSELVLNLYLGFKKGKAACPSFKTNNILVNSSCNMLFGFADLDNKIPSVSRDMRIALDAKLSNAPGKCSSIDNAEVKKVCMAGGYDNLEQLIDLLWD